MVVLTDDQQDRRSHPTQENIIRAMQWLVTEARPDDSLFFHCMLVPTNARHTPLINTDSGHGGQTKDIDGDEADGFDEGPCNE